MNVIRIKFTNLLLAGLVSLLPSFASADTLDRVRANNGITFGYLADAAPFSSLTGNEVDGYTIDLCRAVAAKAKTELGLNNLEVRFKALEHGDWEKALTAGEVDLLCTPATQTLALRKQVSFSLPIYTAGLAVLVREDADATLLRVLHGEVAHTGPTWRATINRGLANHTYVVTKDGASEAWVRDKLRLLGVIANLVAADSPEQAVQMVAEGKADAFFSERILLQNYLAKNKDADELMVLDRIFDFAPVAMPMQRGDEDFRLLVDTALSEAYHSGDLEKIYTQHFGEPGDTVKMLFKVYALP